MYKGALKYNNNTAVDNDIAALAVLRVSFRFRRFSRPGPPHRQQTLLHNYNV